MSSIREFKWLHLSDLHVGMTDQDWLWPTLKHSLFADMEVVLSSVGGCDLVIFSGDLTQRGTPDEFEKLDGILSELWGKFKSWGFLPKLVVLPGNHDIQRAAPLSPELRVLRKWWDELEIHSDFFSEDAGGYRAAVDALFKPYSAWVTHKLRSIEILAGKPGLLPGDASYVLQTSNLKIGLVALNSTWLQIDGSEYEKKLHVDIKTTLVGD
jgi:hypothetical protein